MKPTEIIESLLHREKFTKTELAERLGMTRVTLNTRLKKGNWKKGDIAIIKAL